MTQSKLIINNVEIIACKSELFKKPIIYFINQEISAESEWSIAIVSAPKTDKFTIHDNMHPRLWIAAHSSKKLLLVEIIHLFLHYALQTIFHLCIPIKDLAMPHL